MRGAVASMLRGRRLASWPAPVVSGVVAPFGSPTWDLGGLAAGGRLFDPLSGYPVQRLASATQIAGSLRNQSYANSCREISCAPWADGQYRVIVWDGGAQAYLIGTRPSTGGYTAPVWIRGQFGFPNMPVQEQMAAFDPLDPVLYWYINGNGRLRRQSLQSGTFDDGGGFDLETVRGTATVGLFNKLQTSADGRYVLAAITEVATGRAVVIDTQTMTLAAARNHPSLNECYFAARGTSARVVLQNVQGANSDVVWHWQTDTIERSIAGAPVVHGDVGDATYIGLQDGGLQRFALATGSRTTLIAYPANNAGGAAHISDRAIVGHGTDRWLVVSTLNGTTPPWLVPQSYVAQGGGIYRAVIVANSEGDWFGQRALGVSGAYRLGGNGPVGVLPLGGTSPSNIPAGRVYWHAATQEIFVRLADDSDPTGTLHFILAKPAQDAVTAVNAETGEQRHLGFHGSWFPQEPQDYRAMPRAQLSADRRLVLFASNGGVAGGAVEAYALELPTGAFA